jgi:hypothetical protein
MRRILFLLFVFVSFSHAQRGFTNSNPASSCEDVARDSCEATTSYYWLRDLSGAVSLYKCNMDLDGGGYTEIAYLDLNQSTNANDCTRLYARWERTSVQRGDALPTRCRLARDQVFNGACEGAYFGAPHLFRRAMGQAKVYARGSPDAFGGDQIDGLQIIASTGEPAWIYAAAYGLNGVGQGLSSRYCPCDNQQFAIDNSASLNLDFASNRWSCDGRAFLTDNIVPLFGGSACSPVRSRFFDRFQQSLGADARGLSVKLCRDQDYDNEDISFNFINLLVRPSTTFNRTAVCRSTVPTKPLSSTTTAVAAATSTTSSSSQGDVSTSTTTTTTSTSASTGTLPSVCEQSAPATCKACFALDVNCRWCAGLDFGGRCVANCTNGVPVASVADCPADEGMPWLLSTTTRPLASVQFTTPGELLQTTDGTTAMNGAADDNQGLIIGVVIGVILALLLVALLVLAVRRYSRRSSEDVALVHAQSPLPSPRQPAATVGSGVTTVANDAYEPPVGTTLGSSLRAPLSTATSTMTMRNVAVAKSSLIGANADNQMASARYDDLSMRNPPTFGTPTFEPPTDMLVGGRTFSVAGGTLGETGVPGTSATTATPSIRQGRVPGYDAIPAYDHIPDAPNL